MENTELIEDINYIKTKRDYTLERFNEKVKEGLSLDDIEKAYNKLCRYQRALKAIEDSSVINNVLKDRRVINIKIPKSIHEADNSWFNFKPLVLDYIDGVEDVINQLTNK